jgi:hypothetical protein
MRLKKLRTIRDRVSKDSFSIIDWVISVDDYVWINVVSNVNDIIRGSIRGWVRRLVSVKVSDAIKEVVYQAKQKS